MIRLPPVPYCPYTLFLYTPLFRSVRVYRTCFALASIAVIVEVLGAGIEAAVLFTLDEADRSPLLHAVLTSTRSGDDSLLPFLTTHSAPLLEASTRSEEHTSELQSLMRISYAVFYLKKNNSV